MIKKGVFNVKKIIGLFEKDNVNSLKNVQPVNFIQRLILIVNVSIYLKVLKHFLHKLKSAINYAKHAMDLVRIAA